MFEAFPSILRRIAYSRHKSLLIQISIGFALSHHELQETVWFRVILCKECSLQASQLETNTRGFTKAETKRTAEAKESDSSKTRNILVSSMKRRLGSAAHVGAMVPTNIHLSTHYSE